MEPETYRWPTAVAVVGDGEAICRRAAQQFGEDAAESMRGAHNQPILAVGEMIAAVRRSDSIVCSSSGTSPEPRSQSERARRGARQDLRNGLDVVDPEAGGGGLALADLDTDIGPGEGVEGVLVGDVVADEDHGAGAHL
ncbi:MAG: hypothetical protein R2710_24710 [Acidimicrobiales bacterium]